MLLSVLQCNAFSLSVTLCGAGHEGRSDEAPEGTPERSEGAADAAEWREASEPCRL